MARTSLLMTFTATRGPLCRRKVQLFMGSRRALNRPLSTNSQKEDFSGFPSEGIVTAIVGCAFKG
jgi:hypothetical protein